MRVANRTAAAAVAIGLAVGCGGGGDDDDDAARPDAAVPADAGASARHVLEPPEPGGGAPWGALPYPSDLYLDASGRLALTSLPVGPNADPQMVDMMRDALHDLDGAGVRSFVFFPVAGELDPANLDGRVALVELGDVPRPVPVDVVWRDDLGGIVAAPAYGVVLRERTRYGAYVLRAAGAAPAPAFVEAADLTTVPSDPAVAAVQASVRPLLEALDADTRAEVAAATVFTTESVTAEMVALREAAAAAPPVVSAVEVVGPDAAALDALFGAQDPDATPGWLLGMTRPQPHGHIAAVVHGDIALPNFLAAEPNVAGRIEFDAAGAAVVKGTQSVRFTLVLPKTATDYANLPVVIYVHGINRTRIDMLVEADTAAARGMATLAIDAPYHGSRSSTAGDGRNDLTGDAVPDGFGDLEGLFPSVNFFHLVASGGVPAYHPAAMRDNLRQAAAEICALAAFVVSGDPSPIDAALVAAGLPGKLSFAPRVGILSESFGAMLATVALAVDPNLVAGSVWSIAAGFPYPAMLHSANFSGTFAGVVFSPFDVTARVALGDPIRGARFEPIVMLYDTAIERGDPLAFAPYLVAGSLRGGSGPHLMMTMSWGDEWVPNESHESMFAAAGVPRMPLAAPDSPPGDVLRFVSLPETGAAPVRGNLGGGRQTAAAVVWYPASHAAVRMLNDQFEFVSDQPPFERRAMPEPFDNPAAEAHAMWSRFLAEAVAGDVPSVIDPYAP